MSTDHRTNNKELSMSEPRREYAASPSALEEKDDVR